MTLDDLRAFIRACPETPGVYVIKDSKGTPIYIGKARSLRSRLISHFGPEHHPDVKENFIRKHAVTIQLLHTATEAEALLHEASMIREHKPKYNKMLKDDKSYPFLKITDEEFPRVLIVRGRNSDGSRYFGPYTQVRLLRQAVALIRRLFPLRTCHPLPEKVCLMYHIGQCGGPCEGRQSRESYAETVRELTMFLEGRRGAVIKNLKRRMEEASRGRQYELAKSFRDSLSALSHARVKPSILDKAGVLREMQDSLKLSRFPGRIEAFDISNFSGKNPVGSMVVFENGEPRRSDYRKFKIKTVRGIDDYDMMREVVHRRYERLLNEKLALPDLILIDGGKGHLAAARETLDELNLSDLDLISIAKQHEFLYKPEKSSPYVLPLSSPILHILRHLRDEAHRFAIRFYRGLHRKEMEGSELNRIEGIGPAKKRNLYRAFKTLSAIKAAGPDALRERAGLDMKTAKRVEQYFKRK